MEFKSKKAIYLQIADYVCEKILQKEWIFEQKIPSIREIATMLEVNPNTVTRTYSYLEEQSIIKMQRGVGYFVTKDAVKIILNLKKQEFFNEDLPTLFRMMQLMDITLEEITNIYNKTRNSV